MMSVIRLQRVSRVGRHLFAALLLACLPVAALAHARLVRSKPNTSETVSPAPKLVELWFSEELEPGLNTIEVKDATGKPVDKGEVALAERNKKAQVELVELTSGVYTVVWRALSADQHAMRGSFSFTVPASSAATGTAVANSGQTPAVPSAGATPPPEQMSSMETEDSGNRIVWGRSLVRWLSYLAMMLVFGGFAFRSLVLIPALRRALDGEEQIKAVRAGIRRIVGLLLLGVILLVVTSIIALLLQASDVFDTSLGDSLSPAVLTRVLATGYGSSWILQVGSLLLIVVIVLLLFKGVKRRPGAEQSVLWWVGLLAAAVLLLAPSWTGHAMVSVKHFRLAVVSDWLHLLAGGFWVGGLFHLAFSWPAMLSTISEDHRPAALHQVIRSFTRTAMPSVMLLLFAGLYNTWAHVPSISALWLTPYGKVLAVKVLLVLFMLILGGINNYHFGKRAARLAQKEDRSAREASQLKRSFYRSVAFEASLGLLVLLVTAVLVFMTPARNHPAMDNVVSRSDEGQR